MKFLVTGGAGFIGSNFLNLMVKKYQNDEYVCLDSLTYAGNLSNLEQIKNFKNFKFVKGDILDIDFLDKLFKDEKFDFVINFAAETHVDRSIVDPTVFLKTNILGVENLMNACLKYGVKRYHQVSTDEVYGDLPLDKPELLFTEETPLKTSSPYSASKASADLLVLAYHRTYGLNTTISRCSNNYGPYQFLEKLIPLMIDKAMHDEFLPLYGDGLNVRDWLHVDDHCEAIDLIVRKAKSGEVYNVGGHNEKSNVYIINTILEELHKSPELIKHVKDRLGHDRRYAIDPSKIENELGWRPKYTFEVGIVETIKWYIENQEWVKNLKSGDYLNWLSSHYK